MFLLGLFAFLAGIVTVLSPCVLPVLPAILSASLDRGRYRPLGVVMGLIVGFVFLTLALAWVIQAFGVSANALRYFAIFIIGFFGMVMIFPYLSDQFAIATHFVADLGNQFFEKRKSNRSGFISGFILGLALGFVWTPCAGPILAAITTLVATQQLTFPLILLTVAYSLGAGIPLLLLAYGGQWALSWSPLVTRYAERIRQGFGVIMVLTALALAFNFDLAFQQWIIQFIPNIQIENNTWVQQQLSHLRQPPVGFPTREFDPLAEKDFPTEAVQAPELQGIQDWINSPPLKLEDLRGKVVLIDFWTYSCINCIRTFPYLKQWYETYKDKGFVIIGVHTPEFAFEKELKNVQDAVKRFGLTYPVALDNNYQTWQAYNNYYWPAHYLIDQEGMIRQVHFGEGKYLETENAIRSLLNEKPLVQKEEVQELKTQSMTPEIYLGYERAGHYSSQIQLKNDETAYYSFMRPLGKDQVGLEGEWQVESQFIQAEGKENILELNFSANHVHLVLGGQSDQPVQILLDGKPLPKDFYTEDMNDKGEILVKEPRKYDLIDLKGSDGRHTLSIKIPKGMTAYAFTFG